MSNLLIRRQMMNLMKVSLMTFGVVVALTVLAQNDSNSQGRTQGQAREANERFSMENSTGGASVGAGIPANLSVGASQIKVTTPQQKGGDSNIREVIGKGYGATRQEALDAACRDAIEFAVGLFVDSETLVGTFEMKKDEILTQSNNYIAPNGIEVMWEGPTSRGYCIQIKAKVKMQEVTNSLRGIAPVSTADASPLAGMLATATTKMSRDDRAAALLARELKDFDPIRQLYGIRLVDEPGTDNPILVTDEKGNPKLDNGLYTVRYLYEIYPLTDVYFDVFVPRFDQLLSQISVRKPRTIFMKATCEKWPDGERKEFFLERTQKENFAGVMWQKNFYDLTYNSEVKREGMIPDREDEGVVLSIVTMMNPSLSAITAKDYFLAPKVVDAYGAWEKSYHKDSFYSRRIEYFLQIQDAQGKILAQRAFGVPTPEVLYTASMVKDGGFLSAHRVEWVPLVKFISGFYHANTYATTLRSYIDVQLSAEDMTNARSVSIGLMDWRQ